ncbi:MAG: hypothetical protein FJX74_08775, partial [Armatimonadetes bacterium]|nr:hypothetical protein [Armatimonadota bacterium]
MSRPGALRSRVAVFVCLSLVLSLASPLLATPGQETQAAERVRVAVGACSDSGGTATGAGQTLERALQKSLANQSGVRLVGLENGDPERVLTGRVASLTVEGRHPAKVEVVAEYTDPSTGAVTYRTSVTAEGAVRPGEEQVARVERAIEAAASQVVAQVTRAESMRGHVIGTPRKDTVVLDLGSGQGLTVGSELEVLRDGAVIGKV